MLQTIRHLLGLGTKPPAPPPRPQERLRPHSVGKPLGPAGPASAATEPVPAHDKSPTTPAASGEGQGREPAMAVMRSHAVQMPPPVATSPGLPPVDPEGRLVPSMPATLANAGSDNPHPDMTAGASTGESALRDEPFLPFEPPLLVDSLGLTRRFSDARPGQDVAPRVPLDLAEFLAVRDTLEGSSIDLDKDWHAPDPASSGMDFSPGFTLAYEHSDGALDGVSRKDRPTPAMGGGIGKAEQDRGQPETVFLGVDPLPETGLPRVTTPARDFRRLPQRVADRPRSEEWTDDELLTLPEAAALFWPDGPITTNTLRTAGRDGTLAITTVAGKFFTTPLAIRRMGQGEAGETPSRAPVTPTTGSPRTMFEAKLEEARRHGRERKRRQRAAKRSVAPSN